VILQQTAGDSGFIATMIAVSTILSGAAAFAVAKWFELRKSRRGEQLEDEENTIKRYDALFVRLEKQLAEEKAECKDRTDRLQARIDELSKALGISDRRGERAIVWIRHLQNTLRSKQIEFEPWEESPVTGH
jgi:hypothetical protein